MRILGLAVSRHWTDRHPRTVVVGASCVPPVHVVVFSGPRASWRPRTQARVPGWYYCSYDTQLSRGHAGGGRRIDGYTADRYSAWSSAHSESAIMLIQRVGSGLCKARVRGQCTGSIVPVRQDKTRSTMATRPHDGKLRRYVRYAFTDSHARIL
jgi:hypothetical protein